MKYNLNLEERIQFVDGVVDLSSVMASMIPHYMICFPYCCCCLLYRH